MTSQDPSSMPELKSVHRHVPSFASLRTIAALMLREMTSTYGRSPGGYIWAVLEPALGLLVITLIFSIGFRSPKLGTNFAIFYASGLLPFFMFMNVSMKVQQSINFSKQLLSYPRVTFVDALLARLFLTIIIQSIVGVLIFTFIRTMYETRTILDLGHILNAYAMATAIGMGVGMLNCVLVSRQAIWASIWSVITRPLILISGVIILHDTIPQPYRDWLSWNPLVHVVGESRRGFYYSYSADYVDVAYAYGFALVTAMIGLRFLKTYYRDLLER